MNFVYHTRRNRVERGGGVGWGVGGEIELYSLVFLFLSPLGWLLVHFLHADLCQGFSLAHLVEGVLHQRAVTLVVAPHLLSLFLLAESADLGHTHIQTTVGSHMMNLLVLWEL